jgi:hypothetical protein
MKTTTQQNIDDLIEEVTYHHHDNKVTVCFLKLKSDFYVIGTSGAVDRSTFRPEIGEQYALENAKNKVWELEGYYNSKTF